MEVLSISEGTAHKVHRKWFKAVGDYESFERSSGSPGALKSIFRAFSINKKYDVLICEDGKSSRTGIVWKMISKLRGKDVKLLRIFADSGIQNAINSNSILTKEDVGYRFFDGGIAVSDMLKFDVEDNYRVNVESVFPMILGVEKFQALSKQSYERKNLLFVGSAHDFKNVDALAQAVEGIDVRLHLVGNRHKEHSQENVVTHGRVDDLTKVMQKCDLYVQSSTYEAFGVAPCEAMAAGIPAIVTDKTGCRPFVEKVDPELVTEGSEPEDIREKIEYYYSLSEDERRKRGKKAREAVSELTEENQVERFKEALNALVD